MKTFAFAMALAMVTAYGGTAMAQAAPGPVTITTPATVTVITPVAAKVTPITTPAATGQVITPSPSTVTAGTTTPALNAPPETVPGSTMPLTVIGLNGTQIMGAAVSGELPGSTASQYTATEAATTGPGAPRGAEDEAMLRYWQWYQQRLGLVQDYYGEVLNAYQQNHGLGAPATEAVQTLNKVYADLAQTQDAGYPDLLRQDRATGLQADLLIAQRKQWLSFHPNLRASIAAQQDQVQGLKDEVAAIKRSSIER